MRTRGPTEINLNGMAFDSGIDFAFQDARLAPGDMAVVVRNAAAFALRYGSDIRVLGEYSGKLSNNGEKVSLRIPHADTDNITIEYNDNSLWPRAADGIGATLELVDGAISTELANKYYAWQSVPSRTEPRGQQTQRNRAS